MVHGYLLTPQPFERQAFSLISQHYFIFQSMYSSKIVTLVFSRHYLLRMLSVRGGRTAARRHCIETHARDRDQTSIPVFCCRSKFFTEANRLLSFRILEVSLQNEL